MSPCRRWCSAELTALRKELGGAAESCYYSNLLGVEVATRCLTAVEVKKKKKKEAKKAAVEVQHWFSTGLTHCLPQQKY